MDKYFDGELAASDRTTSDHVYVWNISERKNLHCRSFVVSVNSDWKGGGCKKRIGERKMFCMQGRRECDLRTYEIWILFRKFVEKIRVVLNSDNSDVYSTYRPKYVYDNISLNYS